MDLGFDFDFDRDFNFDLSLEVDSISRTSIDRVVDWDNTVSSSLTTLE
jgi:hypothetical protein